MPEQPISDEPSADDTTRPRKLRFHFIKSSAFRVIHADGAWGGVSPRGCINIAFYSERNPIPQQVVHELVPDGVLGKEIREERVIRDGIVREVEVDVAMNLDAAKALLKWLEERIKFAEGLQIRTESKEK